MEGRSGQGELLTKGPIVLGAGFGDYINVFSVVW